MTETDEQIKARLAKWEKFLETGEALKGKEKGKDITGKVCSKVCATDKEESVSCDDVNSEAIPESEKESEEVVKESDEMSQDSDGGTRSSVGSDYETDDELKSTKD